MRRYHEIAGEKRQRMSELIDDARWDKLREEFTIWEVIDYFRPVIMSAKARRLNGRANSASHCPEDLDWTEIIRKKLEDYKRASSARLGEP